MLRRPAMLAVLVAGAALTGCYAETLPATNLTATSAVLHARGHTDSDPATVYFEYAPSSQGLDSSSSPPFRTPRRLIPANTPGSGKPDLEFHIGVKALKPSTSYDFRVCGREESGPDQTTRCAATRSFTTGAGSPEVGFLRRPAFPVSFDGDFDAADFNRDGKLDLALATSDGPAVRLGDGTGGFGEPTQVPSFSGERIFAARDLNGDAKADLITKMDSPSTIIVRLGDGAGGFSGVISALRVDGRPASPAISDFDRDGDPDLALIVVTGSGLFGTRTFPRLLENDGAGQLTPGPTPNIPDLPGPLAAADLNSDTKPDLVATTVRGPADNDSRLVALLGNGDLTFAAPAAVPIGSGSGALVLGDYNRDGHTDAAIDGAALPGNGKGGFGTLQQFITPAVRPSYRADFNRDGIADLVGDMYGPLLAGVLLGEGNGTFRTPNGFSGIPRAVGDFNRDGKPDVFVVDESLQSTSVLLNTTP